MANTWKLVAQTNPSATTLTDSYTVPASTQFIGHTVVANRGAATTFRISLAPNGAANNDVQYIAYDVPIGANDVYVSPKYAIDATDVVRVYAGAATLTFATTGVEKA